MQLNICGKLVDRSLDKKIKNHFSLKRNELSSMKTELFSLKSHVIQEMNHVKDMISELVTYARNNTIYSTLVSQSRSSKRPEVMIQTIMRLKPLLGKTIMVRVRISLNLLYPHQQQ